MPADWIMVRLPRQLADALRDVAEAREQARQMGHHAHQDRGDVEPLHRVVEMLLEQYHAHARRRSRSAERTRAKAVAVSQATDVYTPGE